MRTPCLGGALYGRRGLLHSWLVAVEWRGLAAAPIIPCDRAKYAIYLESNLNSQLIAISLSDFLFPAGAAKLALSTAATQLDAS